MTATDAATVLIVDDERDVADAYAEHLSERFETVVTYSGRDAMAALDADVDVVLLDRRIPDVDGADVLAEIRDRGIDARVAMVTAVEPDFDIIDLPFDDYVVKPVTRSDLFGTVDRLLACAAYENHVRKYYALTSKHAALKAAKTVVELDDNEEFRALEAELERRRAELDGIVETFDEHAYEVLLRNVDEGQTTPGTE